MSRHSCLELDKNSPHNWLNDNFWARKAYLEWRAPLPINSNWWLSFHNDNLVPSHVLAGSSKGTLSGYTPWQIRRGAWLVHRFLKFREEMAK
jgi:carnitine O-acetyltransferase